MRWTVAPEASNWPSSGRGPRRSMTLIRLYAEPKPWVGVSNLSRPTIVFNGLRILSHLCANICANNFSHELLLFALTPLLFSARFHRNAPTAPSFRVSQRSCRVRRSKLAPRCQTDAAATASRFGHVHSITFFPVCVQ